MSGSTWPAFIARDQKPEGVPGRQSRGQRSEQQAASAAARRRRAASEPAVRPQANGDGSGSRRSAHAESRSPAPLPGHHARRYLRRKRKCGAWSECTAPACSARTLPTSGSAAHCGSSKGVREGPSPADRPCAPPLPLRPRNAGASARRKTRCRRSPRSVQAPATSEPRNARSPADARTRAAA